MSNKNDLMNSASLGTGKLKQEFFNVTNRGMETVAWSQDTSWVVDWETAHSTQVGTNTMDGNTNTMWNAGGVPRYHNAWWIEFNLGSEYTLQGIRIQNWGDTTHDVTKAVLYTSTAQGGTFNSVVASLGSVTAGISTVQDFDVDYDTPVQHLRLVITQTATGYQPYIREIAFQLEDSQTPSPTSSPTPSPTPSPTSSPTPSPTPIRRPARRPVSRARRLPLEIPTFKICMASGMT
ncbi:unnamed protein product [Prorocentrum cordatum]|uniref:F5/8 type C domain-containing protein n=1 Tax=Prorocentrum cordatum TaxID=2364126 RepID=A0ABN9RPT9_9DINO|nr:unnamed protein product [Polarella glacialis]